MYLHKFNVCTHSSFSHAQELTCNHTLASKFCMYIAYEKSHMACVCTVYVKSFEGENFNGFCGFLLTVNVLPLKIFLEYWCHPLTTQSVVPPHLINNEQSVEVSRGTWPTMLSVF